MGNKETHFTHFTLVFQFYVNSYRFDTFDANKNRLFTIIKKYHITKQLHLYNRTLKKVKKCASSIITDTCVLCPHTAKILFSSHTAIYCNN